MTETNQHILARIEEHLPPGDDLTLITLKGHLLAEEVLEEIITSYCRDPSALDGDIGFATKLKFTRALTGSNELSLVWMACQRLNTLRNALAHRLEHPEAKKRLEAFLATFDDPATELKRTGESAADLRRSLLFLLGAMREIEKPIRLGNSS